MNISSISERTRSKRARYMIESDSDGASIGTLDDDHSRGESVAQGCHSNLDNSPGPITRSRAKALSKRHKPESTHKVGLIIIFELKPDILMLRGAKLRRLNGKRK